MLRKNLKKRLNEANWPKESKTFEFLKDKPTDYLIVRAKEYLLEIDDIKTQRGTFERIDLNLILAIRLLNMAREKIHGTLNDSKDQENRT